MCRAPFPFLLDGDNGKRQWLNDRYCALLVGDSSRGLVRRSMRRGGAKQC